MNLGEKKTNSMNLKYIHTWIKKKQKNNRTPTVFNWPSQSTKLNITKVSDLLEQPKKRFERLSRSLANYS